MARKRSIDEAGNEERRKRRKLDFSEQLQELLETLRTYKTETGKFLCETFIRAPNRRSLAEYYDVVSQPIDLIKIQQKVRTDEYKDLESFSHDIELLINNSKSYYKEDTVEYQDACQLWDVFLKLKEDAFKSVEDEDEEDEEGVESKFPPIDEDDTSNDTISEETALLDGGVGNGAGDNDTVSSSAGSEQNNEEDVYEELFSTVMSATSDDGRQIASIFQMLPPKSIYPDYYEIVTEPIDLKMIAERIQAQEYASLNDLEKDLMLVVRNAKNYNAPGSQIYKDANALRKLVITKKAEIELRKSQPLKSSQRIRAKRLTSNNPKWSSVVAALKYEDQEVEINESAAAVSGLADFDEDEEEEEEEEEGIDEAADTDDAEDVNEGSNSLWLLYNAIKDSPNSGAFLRQPSKRFYPDYYKEIKKPMSLNKIGQKLKQGVYANIQQLIADLTLMFDNAMTYNRPDSKIYKDAEKLKKISQMKAKEIMQVYKDDDDEIDEGGDNEDEEEDNDETEDESSSSNVRGTSTKTGKANQKYKTRKSSKSLMNAMSQELTNVRRSQKVLDGALKKRMRNLCSALLDYQDEGRFLIGPFIEKPSRKHYPDYYDIIEHPIDMNTIENNVGQDLYLTEEALITDFMLMFSNCRKYNEDNSQIYKDAVTLEQVLRNKLAELGPLNISSKPKRERVRPSSSTTLKIKTLFETIRDYQDSKGRYLSPIFMKLPSRIEFPDYFEVIRKPICLEKIGQRVKNGIYETVEDVLSDIILMLDNACKYNEPDSQIFKDALTLQQIALQTKIELNEDSVNGIPDVKIIVQDLLTNLFISVYNHQDEEGRCFSDSINELSELGTKNGEVELKTLNFDIIKKNLNSGRYRRMDRFQMDMFEVFERARKLSRTDSQAFEDSIELQQYFITLRNEICKNGKVLFTPALNYDQPQLLAHIEALRREKVPKELNEEDSIVVKAEEKENFGGSATSAAIPSTIGATFDNDEEMVVYQDQVYKTGDYVLVQPSEKSLEPHIIYIEKFRKDAAGQPLIYGCWFYRPHETYHMQSRKFLEHEVFKTDNFTTTPLHQVLRKCCVMFVKEYFRLRPIEIPDEDVFVCESRYQARSKTFKKIKIWPCLQNTTCVPRNVPLPMNRVPSVFKSGVSAATAAPAASNAPAITVVDNEETSLVNIATEPELTTIETSILDVTRANIPCSPPPNIILVQGAQYFEQFTIPAGTFRVGDCAYVRTDQERNLICRIDYMWLDQEQNPFFHGPWFVQQAELPPNTVGSFYPQEVFLSSIEDTNPLLSICERCSVLELLDYAKKRPTEIDEKDVYVCEFRYLEHEKKFEPMPTGMRKFTYEMPNTVVDEIYYFKKQLILTKPTYALPHVLDDVVGQPLYTDPNVAGQAMEIDGTMIAAPMMMTPQGVLGMPIPLGAAGTSAGLSTPTLITTAGANQIIGTPVASNITAGTNLAPSKKKATPKRLVTGYIIFASEVRRSVVDANPDCSFGEISRIIGHQWKVLSQAKKNEYEARAKEQNAEVKEAAAAEKARLLAMSPDEAAAFASNSAQVVEMNQVFSCLWENKCDFQFEDAQDLFDHMTKEPDGHVWVSYAETKDKDPGEFQCLYHGCGRVKKGAAPFPTITRLIRHCKEVHWNKHVPKTIDPERRSKNYVPSTRQRPPPSAPSTPATTLQAQSTTTVQMIGQQQVQQIQGQQLQPGTQTIQVAGQPGQHPQFLTVHHHPHQTHQIQIQQGAAGTTGHVVQVATSQPQPQVVQTGGTLPPQMQLQLQPNGQFQVVQTQGPAHQPGTTYQIHQNPQGQITLHPSHLQQTITTPQGIHLATTAQGQQIQIQAQQQGQQAITQQQQQQVQVQVQQQQAQVQQIQVQPQQAQQVIHVQQQQQQQQQQVQATNQNSTQNQTDQPRLPNIVASTNVVNTLTGQLQTPQQQQQLVSSYPNLSKAISSASANGVHDDCIGVQVKPSEPIFVGIPPKPTKLMHSQTYLKYIQNLKPDSRFVSDWEKEMMATPNNTRTGQARLQAAGNWLANAPARPDQVVDALWTLRNFMLKDALNLSHLS